MESSAAPAVTMAAVAAAMTTAVCGSFSCCAAAEDGEITAAEADADAIPADAEIFKGRNILSRGRQPI